MKVSQQSRSAISCNMPLLNAWYSIQFHFGLSMKSVLFHRKILVLCEIKFIRQRQTNSIWMLEVNQMGLWGHNTLGKEIVLKICLYYAQWPLTIWAYLSCVIGLSFYTSKSTFTSHLQNCNLLSFLFSTITILVGIKKNNTIKQYLFIYLFVSVH